MWNLLSKLHMILKKHLQVSIRIIIELIFLVFIYICLSGSGTKIAIPNKQLAQACLVVSILDPKVKRDLLKWFVNLQLQEYHHLFQESEDTSWLDKIDKRYAWIKRHLLEFEDRLGIFI